jgi:hypothetical protein
MGQKSKNNPKWFDLSDYEPCISWSVREWCNAIALRQFLFKVMQDSERYIGTPDWQEFILRHIELMAEKLRSPAEKPEQSYRAVAPLTMEQASFIFDDFQSSLDEGEMAISSADDIQNLLANSLESPIAGNSYDQTRIPPGNCHGPRDLIGYIHAAIDLSAPDEILVEHFKKYVAQQRASLNWQSREKTVSERDFRDWHHLRLLPFLDLTLWSKASGIKLTNIHLANLLFPDEYDVDLVSRVRRTVRPKAENLLSQDILNALETQSISET